MQHRRALGLIAAGVVSVFTAPAWAENPSTTECIPSKSQQGVLLQALVDQVAKDIEAPRKAGDYARVLDLAGQAQETHLCDLPPNIALAQAEALVATERACEAEAPLDRFFAAAKPGDKDYGKAEDLFEQVSAARESGLCEKPLGGVALAEPTEAPAASHEDTKAVAGEPGSERDNYRGGELNEGSMAYDGGNYARAAELFTVVIQQAPESFEGYQRRAQAYAKLGQTENAIADYNKAIQLAPARGYLLTDFADYLMRLNRVPDALALYDAYLERYPDDVQVLRARAVARQKAGMVDLALEDYGKAIALAPGNPQFLLGRAYVYHDNGRFEDAVNDFTAAIAAGATGADVYYRRGLAYYALNRADEAIADFDKAVAADPKLAGAYTARGTLYQYRGDGEAAIADFSRVIELRPRSAAAYVDRGKEYQRQLRLPEAIADYSDALRLQSGNLEALKGRAVIYQQQGDYANALDDLTQLINRDLADGDAYARRGWVYFGGKDYARANDDFDKALVVDPGNTQAKLGLQAVADAIAAEQKAAAEAAKKRR